MGNGQDVTYRLLLYIVTSNQLRESRRTCSGNHHDLQDHIVDGARFDLGGFDAHGYDDTMNGLDSILGLIFPPFHSFVKVLVESFHLHRCELKALEPFLEVCLRQRLRGIVGEEVTGCTWSDQQTAGIKGRCCRRPSVERFLDRL